MVIASVSYKTLDLNADLDKIGLKSVAYEEFVG